MFRCIPLATGTRAFSCAVRIIPFSWMMQAHDTLTSSCSLCHFRCVHTSKYAVFYFASLPQSGMPMNVQQVRCSAALSIGIAQLGTCVYMLGQRQEVPGVHRARVDCRLFSSHLSLPRAAFASLRRDICGCFLLHMPQVTRH